MLGQQPQHSKSDHNNNNTITHLPNCILLGLYSDQVKILFLCSSWSCERNANATHMRVRPEESHRQTVTSGGLVPSHLDQCLDQENIRPELLHYFYHLTDTLAINNSMKNEEGGRPR